MNEKEYQNILSEIIEISRKHQNNARVQTLKSECLENLYAIARKNPYTQFGLWTKNYTLIWKLKAPKNVNIILSNPFLNEALPNSDLLIKTTKARTGAKNVKIFSVYDKDTIQNQNCEKHCITCLKCYSKKDKTTEIIELLK